MLRSLWKEVLSNTIRPATSHLSSVSLHEEKVSIYGLNLNIVKTGKGEKALLLMPGALGTAWTDFKPQLEGLPNLLPNYTIVGWDPPGSGKSMPEARQFSSDIFESDAHFAIDLMSKLKLETFSVLGTCRGGITALVLAGRFPQFIDKVIVWSCSAFLSINELKRLDSILGVSNNNNSSSSNQKPLVKLYGPEVFAEKWSGYLNAITQIVTTKKGDFCRAEVDCIQAPTLIMHGAQDPVITKDHISYLITHIKNAKFYEFPDGKHNINFDYANEFNNLVSQFLLEKPKV